jgi:hypothetical protein
MKSLKCIRIVSLLCVLILMGGLKVALALDHTTIKSYSDRSFSLGWTHNVNTPNGILWYNSQTGAGVVGRIDSAGNHVSIKTMNFSPGWTHIVNTPNGILYYNSLTGAGAVGLIDNAGNHTTIKTLQFSKGWTHLVNTPNGIVYYNSLTGAGAVGRLE